MHFPAGFSACRVLVCGDVMLDRYWHGATARISPEAPVPVVQVKNDEVRAGGAGNVALNAASWAPGAGHRPDRRRRGRPAARRKPAARGVACAFERSRTRRRSPSCASSRATSS
jgi:D-beta-D-heptose 7-phosphate kinase/D-beta-D-heptose 1-phosphate adenosyltransferase